MRLHSKLGFILSSFYLGFFALAVLHMFYSLVFDGVHSEFSALPTILVTLPWSMMLIPLLDSLGYIAWYEQFSANSVVYGFFALLPLLLAALFNAAILYACAWLVGRLFHKS